MDIYSVNKFQPPKKATLRHTDNILVAQASIMGSVPSIAVYFGVYQFMKRVLTASLGLHMAISVSAACANLLAAIVRVPFEIVKQRLQAGVYADTVTALREIFASGGVWAFLPIEAIQGQVRFYAFYAWWYTVPHVHARI